MKQTPVIVLAAWLACCAGVLAQEADRKPFMVYPEGGDPSLIGKRLCENLLSRECMPAEKIKSHYAEACTAQGALEFSGLIKDIELRKRLVARYEPGMAEMVQAKMALAHVDYSVFGIIPFEIFQQTGDERFLEFGRSLADDQWKAPLLENGLTRQTRWWIDDMYMVGALLKQASRATKDPIYAERAGLFLNAYVDKLQQPNGLFFHGPQFKYFWGRGNGWVAVAMADVLSVLPETSSHRARLMAAYQKMMAGLLAYQGPNGLWRQLIDKPEAWEESSGSAMFTYAFITGVRNGWLEKATYGQAAGKGWIGLVRLLDSEANLKEICVGTGQRDDINYYLERPRIAGDFHGQAPMLWCVNALLR